MLETIADWIAAITDPVFVGLYTLFSVIFALPGLDLGDILSLIF